MNQEQKDPAAELLRLADDDYFALSETRRMEIADAFSELSNDESVSDPAAIRPRLALGAPQRVDLKARGSAPVLLGTFETALRAWQVNLKPNLIVFVKSRATGEMLAAKPLISVRRGLDPLPSAGGTPPTGAPAAATKTSMVVINLLDRLAGKLVDGDIWATAVAYDTRSNTVRMGVDGAGKPKAPVANKQTYVRSDLDARVKIDSELVVPAQGSAKSGFRIRVARQLNEADGILRTELNQPFLPCHVVLVRVDHPAVVIAATPLVQQVALPEGKVVFNALFLVDLGGEKGHSVSAGDYQVYVDLGGDFQGPYPLRVE